MLLGCYFTDLSERILVFTCIQVYASLYKLEYRYAISLRNNLPYFKLNMKTKETRATFILNEDLLEEIKLIAYWDRLLIKDCMNDALTEYVQKWKINNLNKLTINKE